MVRLYTSKVTILKILNNIKNNKNLKFKDVSSAFKVIASKSIHDAIKPNKKGYSYQITHKKKLDMIRKELQNILKMDEVNIFLTRFNNI